MGVIKLSKDLESINEKETFVAKRAVEAYLKKIEGLKINEKLVSLSDTIILIKNVKDLGTNLKTYAMYLLKESGKSDYNAMCEVTKPMDDENTRLVKLLVDSGYLTFDLNKEVRRLVLSCQFNPDVKKQLTDDKLKLIGTLCDKLIMDIAKGISHCALNKETVRNFIILAIEIDGKEILERIGKNEILLLINQKDINNTKFKEDMVSRLDILIIKEDPILNSPLAKVIYKGLSGVQFILNFDKNNDIYSKYGLYFNPDKLL